MVKEVVQLINFCSLFNVFPMAYNSNLQNVRNALFLHSGT